MKTPAKNSPLIDFEAFLRKAMGSETEANFAEFLILWQSSESLKQRIRQFVENSPVSFGQIGHNEESSLDSKIDHRLASSGSLSSQQVEKHLRQSHGGLSRRELLVLLEKYKSGNRELGVYLMVRAWKRYMARPGQSPDARLKQLTLEYLSQAIAENRTDFFQEIADFLRFLKNEEFRENGQWNHDPGQWWQFHLLLYILEHPKDKYPMREFVRYFETEIGVNEMPTTKTLRSFCRSSGIALDSTPGAPKKP